MSFWHSAATPVALLSEQDGELVSVRISTDPRSLEDLLECLARISFPVNPQLFHGVPTVVEFPAYETQLGEVRRTLKAYGFERVGLEVNPMFEKISD